MTCLLCMLVIPFAINSYVISIRCNYFTLLYASFHEIRTGTNFYDHHVDSYTETELYMFYSLCYNYYNVKLHVKSSVVAT